MQIFATRVRTLLGTQEVEIDRLCRLIKNCHILNNLKTEWFQQIIQSFRINMGLADRAWGGAEEITKLEHQLTVFISDIVLDPESDEHYIPVNLNEEERFATDPNREVITIEQTTPTVGEAIDSTEDINMQLGRALSAQSSSERQHYRLRADASSLNFEQANAHEQAQVPAQTLQSQHFKFLAMGIEFISAAQTAFNPTKPQNKTGLLQILTSVLSNRENKDSIFSKAQLFFKDSTPMVSMSKSSENRTTLELMLLAVMTMFQQHFSILGDEPPTEEMTYDIASNIICKCATDGTLDYWGAKGRQWIEAQEDLLDDARSAMCELFDGALHLIKYMGHAPGYDMKDYPPNKYIDFDEWQFGVELGEWLEKNPEHHEYDEAQAEFMTLNEKHLAARFRGIVEIGKHILSLMSRIVPDMPFTQDGDEMVDRSKRDWQATQQREFKAFIMGIRDLSFLFEPNLLRAFFNYINRYDYQRTWYQAVCESFEDQYQDSPFHQKVKQMWILSQLDTINLAPLDARSRMPGASLHGQPAPNFGYRMCQSEEYQQWQQHPLSRACGDIIVDVYHAVVDFGVNLGIPLFLEHLSNYRTQSGIQQHLYDRYTRMFMLHVLEQHFGIKVRSEFNRIKTSALKKKALELGTEFLDAASMLLHDFQDYCRRMSRLIPAASDTNNKNGFVFGIGFNGALFKTPNHERIGANEVWLAFSQSTRESGGYLALAFIQFVSHQTDAIFGDAISKIRIDDDTLFRRYKALICRQLAILIKQNYAIPGRECNRQQLANHQSQRRQYEDYLIQLESSSEFNALSFKLKCWIRDLNNWYFLPQDIKVHIAPEMPIEELEVQRASYQLVFDALVGRSLDDTYPEMIPLLEKHWSGNINAMFNQVHPELRSAWEMANIKTQFERYLDDRVSNAKATVNQIRTDWNRNKKSAGKLRTALSKAKGKDIDLKKKEIGARLADADKKTQDDVIRLDKAEQLLIQVRDDRQFYANNLATTPNPLYSEFREWFFRNNAVENCVEPVLARVVGHDRFFSVYISKGVGDCAVQDSSQATPTPLMLGNRYPQSVIHPCNTKCRYNALGHLYVGDMLSRASADRLDRMRRAHNLGEVPDLFTTFESGNYSKMMECFGIFGGSDTSNETRSSTSSTADESSESRKPSHSPRTNKYGL